MRSYVINNIVSIIPHRLFRLFVYRRIAGFKIGKGTSIQMRAWFDTVGNLSIGESTVINQSVRLDNRGGLTIGSNVSIAADSTILTADHDLRSPTFAYRARPVVIEDYVFLGTRSLILPGVTIGFGAVVAAGSVVTKSVEPLTIVGGSPAKLIGHRPSTALEYTLTYAPSWK